MRALIRHSLLAAAWISVVPMVSFAQAVPAPVVDPTNEARTHFDRGLLLFNQQDDVGALAEFQRAYVLSHRVSVLFNLGVTYQALHRYPQAAAAIEEYLARADSITPERRAQVEQALTEIRGFIAHVRLRVSPANAVVTLDGDLVPPALLGAAGVPVGPGEHQVEVTAPGHEGLNRSFRIASGDVQDLPLDLPVFAPPQRAPPLANVVLHGLRRGARVTVDGRAVSVVETQHVPAGVHRYTVSAAGMEPWTQDLAVASGVTRTITLHLATTHPWYPTLFVGGAALTATFAVGTLVFGLLTAATHAELSTFPYNDAASQAVASRGVTERLVTNVSIAGMAIAAAGTGLVYLLMRQADHSTADIALVPAPGGIAARLRVSF